MQAGDIIVCSDSYGVMLTRGKAYTVLDFDPGGVKDSTRFRHSAYVQIEDDEGSTCWVFPERFNKS